MNKEALDHAILLLNNGDKKSAEIILSQYVEQNPTDEMAWIKLSESATTVDKAKKALEKIIQINPQNNYAKEKLKELSSSPDIQQVEKTVPKSLGENNRICPVCGKDDMISKVTSIVSAGTRTSVYEGHEIGVAGARGSNDFSAYGVGVGKTTGVEFSQTNLSQQLNPPNNPTKKIKYWPYAASLLGIIFLIKGIQSYNAGSDNPQVFCAVPLLCLTIPLLLIGGIKVYKNIIEVKKGREMYPIWQKSIKKWQRIYFCQRDGIVFDPVDSSYQSVEKMKDFLQK